MIQPRVVALVSILLLPLSSQAQTADSGAEALPGRVVLQEGGVYMVCEGVSGDLPTVIFENGLGEGLDTWRDVQPEISSLTRSCAYDRLGAGQSDPVAADDSRTPFEQAATLKALLTAAGIDGPYVLAGHSIAGLILLAYPHLYPEDIAGLVFVDASHPQQWNRFREVNPDAADPRGTSGRERVDRGAATDELASVGDFGDLPVAVLYQARPTESPLRPIWVELQEDHASRSTRHRLIPARNSGHYVHNDEPGLVIDAIRWALKSRAQ